MVSIALCEEELSALAEIIADYTFYTNQEIEKQKKEGLEITAPKKQLAENLTQILGIVRQLQGEKAWEATIKEDIENLETGEKNGKEKKGTDR